jgi:hypothetical protein
MTTKEHMKYHKGLWTMLGCKMKVIEENKRKDIIVYIDLNSKKDVVGLVNKYTYTSKGKDLAKGLIQPITVGVHYA